MDSSRSNANIRGTLLRVVRRCWNFPRRVDLDLQRYDAMMIPTARTQDSKRAGRAHLATVVASAVAAALVGIGTGTGPRARSRGFLRALPRPLPRPRSSEPLPRSPPMVPPRRSLPAEHRPLLVSTAICSTSSIRVLSLGAGLTIVLRLSPIRRRWLFTTVVRCASAGPGS